MAKFLAYAFKTQEARDDALKAVSEQYHDLQTNTAEQILDRGFQYVLFIEDKSSFTFNLTLGSMVQKYGGISRDKVRI